MQSIYLDTAISVVLVILLFSVLTYAVQEWWSAVRQLRGKMLEYAVFEALNDKLNKSFGVLLYEHPQIDLLKMTQESRPSYMPSSNFAVALIDLISRESTVVSFITDPDTKLLREVVRKASDNPYLAFKAGVDTLNHSDLKILLGSFLYNAADMAGLQKNIENWFNQYMDRVSGWYRKKTSYTVGFISLAVVLLFNFDMIFLVKNIYGNAQLRNALVAQAQQVASHPEQIRGVIVPNLDRQLATIDSTFQVKIKATTDTAAKKQLESQRVQAHDKAAQDALDKAQKDISTTTAAIDSLNLPIGWRIDKKGLHQPITLLSKGRQWWIIPIGWLLSAILISFGAPFWFNLLIKLVPLRKTGVKPDSKKIKN
jgi:hypothetical protein